MNTRKTSQGGFSLAEVVVALAIVGIALLYFSLINHENVKRSSEAYNIRLHKTLAREVMEEFLLKRTSDATEEPARSGVFDSAPGFRWVIDDSEEFTVPFEDDDEPADDGTEKSYTRYLIKVELKIYQDSGVTSEEVYSLVTMIQEKRDNE